MFLLSNDLQKILIPALADGNNALVEMILNSAGVPFRKEGPVALDETYNTSGNIATVQVKGVLGNGPYYMTTYENIAEGIELANADASIKDIDMYINSPGGNVMGLYECAKVIRNSKKPVTVYIYGMASSAAYILASQGVKVIAIGPVIQVGCVGVVREVWDDKGYWKNMGIAVEEYVNKESPDKRPKIGTERGDAVHQKAVDDIYTIFAEVIAEAQGITIEVMNETYGRGATFTAVEALKRGMIDEIQNYGTNQETTQEEKETVNMSDIKSTEGLKAEHGDLCKKIESDAVASEQNRVNGWMAWNTTDPVAVKAGIESGEKCEGETLVALATKAAGKKTLEDEASENADDVETPSSETGATEAQQEYTAMSGELKKLMGQE